MLTKYSQCYVFPLSKTESSIAMAILCNLLYFNDCFINIFKVVYISYAD